MLLCRPSPHWSGGLNHWNWGQSLYFHISKSQHCLRLVIYQWMFRCLWFVFDDSVSNMHRDSGVVNRHACRVWMHTNTCSHCHKHTLRFRDTRSYISINTVPSRSPCAELLIASLILICQIPLGSYHWRVSLRVKNTVLSSLVPSLAFPTPSFKNSPGLNRLLCFGKDSAMLTLSPNRPVTARGGPQTQMCLSLSHHCVTGRAS